MARHTHEFPAFGSTYRVTDLSAAEAFRLFLSEGAAAEVDPLAVLRAAHAEVIAPAATAPSAGETGEWLRLDSRAAVNRLVRDPACGVANHIVLAGLLRLIRERNIGFLLDGSWLPVPIPSRLRSGVEPVRLAHVDPILSTLVANSLASLRELQEFYSLRDAFDMFDIFSADSLNKALASEAAVADAKKSGAAGRR
ncbi:hypothetical protein [Cupriavidus sp. TMH.W2]|uniref:hypothetical protein n=1 Tax=Cupriavidus sp. TMH.W2 TaxID=3434465 RepID=UPI003D76D4C0